MWSYARHDLGLSDDEFWHSTARQLQWLGRRRRHRIYREESFIGMLCAQVENYSMRAPQKPVSPADFMPTEITKKARAAVRPERLKRRETASVMRAVFSNIPGVKFIPGE